MDAINALIYVNIVIWLGFGAYAVFLARKQNNMDKRLNTLLMETKNDKDA